eukprot:721087-Pyramimonas_sp.AAC.1
MLDAPGLHAGPKTTSKLAPNRPDAQWHSDGVTAQHGHGRAVTWAVQRPPEPHRSLPGSL